MNYTTLAKVKAALGAAETTDDALLAVKILEASRAIDTTVCHAQPDYFKYETVTDELQPGIITTDGVIVCWSVKSVVSEVVSFEYRTSPRENWQTVEVAYCTISNRRQINAWGAALPRNVRVYCKIGYKGGYGTESGSPATITGLPEDVINAATVLAVRFYKEEKTGLSDAIGVADLGMLQYTKAIPTRVVEMLKPYKRIVA